MDAFEQWACEATYETLVELFRQMPDYELYKFALDVGIKKENLPKQLHYLIGSMMCCGEVVLANEHCKVCGSLNWDI